MKPSLTLLLTAALIGFSTVEACNNETHFDCKSVGSGRSCVPLEWICDNVADCENGLDESHCSYIHQCEPGQMSCHDGECIDKSWKCNGMSECRNGHDERGCEEFTASSPRRSTFSIAGIVRPSTPTPSVCPAHRYQCKNGPCIMRAFMCDGDVDCPLGDDESDCSDPVVISQGDVSVPPALSSHLRCRPNHVQCADASACVPQSWVCDGEPDCDDGSDESSCSEDDSPAQDIQEFVADQTNHMLCSQGSYRCQGMDGLCIPMNKTCDGTMNCPSGDDERGMCGECQHISCDHRCQDTPHGPKCLCQTGFELDSDGVSCNEIDECKHHGHRCSQFCESRNGRYACSCAAGYKLHDDGHKCMIGLGKNNEGTLFISIGSEIRKSDLLESTETGNPITTYGVYQTMYNSDSARSLSFHSHVNKLFMAIPGGHDSGHISFSSNGLFRTLREHFTGLGYIAVDWISDNVFFTLKHPSSRPGIYVCTHNLLYCSQVIKGQIDRDDKKKQLYRGLAVNALRGEMCWIDVYGDNQRIKCSNLDGSQIHTVVEHKIDFPSGLAFDILKNQLYFGDVQREMIEKVDLETLERTIVVSSGVHHPYDLQFFDGKIFWSDWALECVKVVDVSSEHHAAAHIVHSFHGFPFGLAINHTLHQPRYHNSPCKEDGFECAWACVSVIEDGNLVPKCMCPDDYVRTKNECLPPRNKTLLLQPISQVNPAYAYELCEKGYLCGPNGKCVEEYNRHNTIVAVHCSCDDGFTGTYCEIADPYFDPEALKSDTSFFGVICFVLLFFAIVAGVFYMAYNRSETVSKIAKNSIHAVQDAVPNISNGITKRFNSVRSNVGPLLPTSRPTVNGGAAEATVTPDTTTSPGGGVRAVFDTFENPSFDCASAPIEVSYSKKFGGAPDQY